MAHPRKLTLSIKRARALAALAIICSVSLCGSACRSAGNSWTRFPPARVTGQGATGWTKGLQVAALPSGDMVWLGCFNGLVDFGVGRGKTAAGWSPGDDGEAADVFVARVGPDGRSRWVRHLQGNCVHSGDVRGAPARVAVTPTGMIVVAVASKARTGFEPLERPCAPPIPNGCAGCLFVGGDDVVVSALDGNGSVLWTTGMGLDGWGEVAGLAADSAGGVVVAATFRGMLAARAGSPEFRSDGTDILVGSVGRTGRLERRTVLSGASYEAAADLALDTRGDIVVVGNFWETLEVGSIRLRAAGGRDAFVVKLSPTGEVRWARSFGSAAVAATQPADGEEKDKAFSEATAVALSSNGHVLVAGYMEAALDFGGGLLQVRPSTDGRASRHGFVACLDGARGRHRWSRAFPALRGRVLPEDLTMERDEPVVALTLPGPTTADIGDASPTVSSRDSLVLVKLDGDNGTNVWSRRVEGEPAVAIAGVAAAHEGIFVTGTFNGRLRLANATLAGITPGAQTAFLARVSP